MEAIKNVVKGVNSARRRLTSLGAATVLLTSLFVISIDGIVGVRIASASTQAGMLDTTFPTSSAGYPVKAVTVAANGNIFIGDAGMSYYSPSGARTQLWANYSEIGRAHV
jgi:hypothetical protein